MPTATLAPEAEVVDIASAKSAKTKVVKPPPPFEPQVYEFDRSVLADAVAGVGRVAASVASQPLIGGIRIAFGNSRAVLSATNLDQFISRKVTVRGSKKSTVTVVSAKLFANVVKATVGETVTVTVDEDQVTVQAGELVATLRSFDSADFPAFPEIPESPAAVTVSAYEFVGVLSRCSVAAMVDEQRPILNGVHVAKFDGEKAMEVASTDSYRLTVASLDEKSGFLGKTGKNPDGTSTGMASVLIPVVAVKELAKAVTDTTETIDVKTWSAATDGFSRRMAFTFGDTVLVTRLIEGEFPKYRQLIPAEQPGSVTVNRARLVKAVNAASIVIGEGAPVRLTITADSMTVTGIQQDIGSVDDVVACQATVALDVAFNPVYLNAGLGSFEDDEVTISFTDGLKPCTITGTGQGFMYLIMPVRVP